MKLEVSYAQHSGKLYKQQQDALWNGKSFLQSSDQSVSSYILEQSSSVFIIADGVAISPSPHLASRFVVKSIAREVSEKKLTGKLVKMIHGSLCDNYGTGKTRGSATTIVAAKCHKDICHIVNVGDSRAYLINGSGAWEQLSHDHTILNDMIEKGEIEPGNEYAQMYDDLAYCLIADDEEYQFPVYCHECSFQPGNEILLCSDGVHDTLGYEALVGLYNSQISPSEQVSAWRKAILDVGAPDNFSIIFARYLSAE